MREYRDELVRSGINVHFIELESRSQESDYFDRLSNCLEELQFRQLNFFEIELSLIHI